MKIAVFLHGTAIMHRGALGKPREERVRQVQDGEASVLDFGSYVPTEHAVRKLLAWVRQGAQVVYLSSHKQPSDVDLDRAVLKRHGFPAGPVLHRTADQTYADLVEQVLPDVLIEDDCESIGGESQMIFPAMRPDLQARVRLIVVREFGGLADLPDPLIELRAE